MNERIKELAEQARLIPVGQPDGTSPYMDVLNHFAELIVRECASVVAEYCDPRFTWITPKTLLYHFGIKE